MYTTLECQPLKKCWLGGEQLQRIMIQRLDNVQWTCVTRTFLQRSEYIIPTTIIPHALLSIILCISHLEGITSFGFALCVHDRTPKWISLQEKRHLLLLPLTPKVCLIVKRIGTIIRMSVSWVASELLLDTNCHAYTVADTLWRFIWWQFVTRLPTCLLHRSVIVRNFRNDIGV